MSAPDRVPDRPWPLPQGLDDGRPYFLAVGALEPRKAPDVLADAYAIARTRGLDADLVFVGTGRLAAALEGPGVHLLGRVEDAALDALYRAATGLVMPSWLEGFGFPPLEAAVRGTPAIVSDLPVFDETLGQAALRVPPGNAEALADALLCLAQDDGLRDRLAGQAAHAAASLTWARAADATHAVLCEAAGARS